MAERPSARVPRPPQGKESPSNKWCWEAGCPHAKEGEAVGPYVASNTKVNSNGSKAKYKTPKYKTSKKKKKQSKRRWIWQGFPGYDAKSTDNES